MRISDWSSDVCSSDLDSHPDQAAGNSPAVLIAPGSLHKLLEPGEVEPYARWLLDRHAQGAVLASNCGGAFALAATGLLSGRPATTQWFFAEEFRRRFPDVRMEARSEEHTSELQSLMRI